MIDRRLPLCLLCLFAINVQRRAVEAFEPPRPNIVVFYVDDMGWGAIGPNGQAQRRAKNLPNVRTPNLDKLAAAGVNFSRGYGCTVCSPARSSLQTGFHQGHTFADRNDPDNAKKAIRADDPSIGKSLAAAGYATGYWGKWGYGGSKDQQQPVLQNVQTLPTSHGYQFVLAELHHVRAHTFFQPTLWHAPASENAVGGLELVPNSLQAYQRRKDWPTSPALQDHRAYPPTAYCDDAYAFAALEFVRRQGMLYRQTGQPFHALLAVQIPHAPFGEIATLPEWDRAYADDPHFAKLSDQSRQWAAMVTRMDAHLGNILAALEDPNADGDPADSIASDTLVVFQSDNGGPGGMSHQELATNGPLRGNKGSILEGGLRVPMIVRWPSAIHATSLLRAGTTSDRVVDVTDLLPTFCELAGAPIPAGIDGVSLAPTLLGSGTQRKRDFIIHEAGNQFSIIRDRYKLIGSRKQGPLKLYDLKTDPGESTNLADDLPELAAELEGLLLGERVAEPQGFANTYHHWIGQDGASLSQAENWSDYIYANAGITYLEDHGPPRPSWVARIVNDSKVSQRATADHSLAVLGLELRGNPQSASTQTLQIDPDVELIGRNEIRVGAWGVLDLHGGSASSLRWIDVAPAGKLTGHGQLQATVFNAGRLTVHAGNSQGFTIAGDFHQTEEGTLSVAFGTRGKAAVIVSGVAHLDGKLVVTLPEEQVPQSGDAYTVLTAEEISGSFSNSPNELVTANGLRFDVELTSDRVRVICH